MKTKEKLFKSILDYHSGHHEKDDSLYKFIWYSICIDPDDRDYPMHQSSGKFHDLNWLDERGNDKIN